MRLFVIAAMLVTMLVAPPATAQPLPDSMRAAGVTEAQWDTIRSEARRQAQRARISEASLIAAAQAAGVNLANSGQFDAPRLRGAVYDALAEQANQIAELQGRLDALTGDSDPAVAAMFAQARTALNEGRLAEADGLLAQSAERDLAAIQQADAEVERRRLRAGETIAARAQVAFVQADYVAAAQHYGRAAEIVPQSAILQRGQYSVGRGAALFERSNLFGEPEALEQAIAAYEFVLALPQYSRADWALIQNDLGNVFMVQAERGVPGALERAIAAYEAVLEVSTRISDPVGWAGTQMNLGNALSLLGGRGEPGALERAVAAYEGVLRVRTRESDPLGWADAQLNLGGAYVDLGETSRALDAFEAALTVFTREDHPEAWAMAMTNLGVGFDDAGQHDRAIEIYEEVLEVRTREIDPFGWALAQQNLGASLGALGFRGEPGAFERAAQAFEAALTVMTRESSPADWAALQHNLAILYRAIGRRGDARAAAQAALVVFEEIGDAERAENARRFLELTPME